MCKSRLSGGGGEGGGEGGDGEEGGGGGGQNLFVIMQSVRRLARSRVKTKWCVVLLRRPHPALQHLRPGWRAARYQTGCNSAAHSFQVFMYAQLEGS